MTDDLAAAGGGGGDSVGGDEDAKLVIIGKYEELVRKAERLYGEYVANPSLPLLNQLILLFEEALDLRKRPFTPSSSSSSSAAAAGEDDGSGTAKDAADGFFDKDSPGENIVVYLARRTAEQCEKKHGFTLNETFIPTKDLTRMHEIAEAVRQHRQVSSHMIKPFLTLSAPNNVPPKKEEKKEVEAPEAAATTSSFFCKAASEPQILSGYTSDLPTTLSTSSLSSVGSPSYSFGTPSVTPSDLTRLPSDLRQEELEDEEDELTRSGVDDGSLGEMRNWTKEFQEALEMPCGEPKERLERSKRIRDIAEAFARTASVLGKRIIEENSVAGLYEKRIIPEVKGGVAGGHKFRIRGIFFKFSVDKYGLYGGDHFAMKAANHELLGLTAYFNCSLPELHLPLMAVIDYCGFRLTAISELPIDDERTLCYGSNDGGNTIQASDPTAIACMQQAAGILNLRSHIAGNKAEFARELCAPADIEVHRCADGRLYILDTARVFPPEPPDPNVPGSTFYRLLRPELVRSNLTPLSSDAFSKFGRFDDEEKEYQADVRAAYRRLFYEIIPSLVLSLNQKIKRMTTRESPTLPSVLAMSKRICLPDELHREGINIRYLDELKKCDNVSPHPLLLIMINTQIVARQMKRALREQFRFLLRQAQAENVNGCGLTDDVDRDLPIHRQCIANSFNEVMCAVRLQCLDRGEVIDTRYLMDLLSEQLGLKLKPEAVEAIICGQLMRAEDVEDIVPRVRYTSDVPYQEGVALYYQATAASSVASTFASGDGSTGAGGSTGGSSDPVLGAKAVITVPQHIYTEAEADALLAVAAEKFDEALRSQPDAYMILTHWGMLLLERAKLHREDSAVRDGFLQMAMDKFAQVVSIRPNFHYAFHQWGELLRWWSECKETIDHDPAYAKELSRQADTKFKQACVFRKCWFFGTFGTNGISSIIRKTSLHISRSKDACASGSKKKKRPHKLFLIRSSNNRPGYFVYTPLVFNKKTGRYEAQHILINETIDGRYYIKSGVFFNSLEEFVSSKINEGFELITNEWSESEKSSR